MKLKYVLNLLALFSVVLLSGCLPLGNGEPYGFSGGNGNGKPPEFTPTSSLETFYHFVAVPVTCAKQSYDYDDRIEVTRTLAVRRGNPCAPIQATLSVDQLEISVGRQSLVYQGSLYEKSRSGRTTFKHSIRRMDCVGYLVRVDDSFSPTTRLVSWTEGNSFHYGVARWNTGAKQWELSGESPKLRFAKTDDGYDCLYFNPDP